MGQIQLLISIVTASLFVVAILGFATQFAIDNGAAINIADDPELSLMQTNLGSNLSEFNTKSEDTYSSIINTTIEPGSDVVSSTAIFALTPTSLGRMIYTVTYTAYQKIFGTGGNFSIFFTTFIALIVILAALYLIKTWKGNPD